MWKSTFVMAHPSEVITIKAESENGRSVEVFLTGEHIDILRQTFANEQVAGHLGHAYHHARNPEYEFPCQQCRAKENER